MSAKVFIGVLCGFALVARMSAQEVVIVRDKKPKIPQAEAIAPKPSGAEFHIEKAIAVQPLKPPAVVAKPSASKPAAIVQIQTQKPAIASSSPKVEIRAARATIPAPTARKPETDTHPAQSVAASSAVAKPVPPVRKSESDPHPAQPAVVSSVAAKPVPASRKAQSVAASSTASKPAGEEQSGARLRKPEKAVASSAPSREVRESSKSAIKSVSLQGATAFTKLADGFDFPVGKPDAQGYYKARGFRSHGHLGEDWDGVGGGDTDLGDPIYCIGNGVVVFARDCHMGWGNVLIVRHAYREGGTIKNIDSFYGHLQRMLVRRGDVVARGQQIATMGNAHGLYDAHLHLEIRKNIEIGMSRAAFARDFNNYYDPTQFILSHRHLQARGGTYRIAMNTFTHDSHIRWDKARNYSGYRGGGGSESAVALKKALASQNTGAR